MAAIETYEPLESSKSIRVLSVTSGKGGVGKSSIVLNLALSLSKEGKRVLILDADVGLANVDVMLGVKPNKSLYHVLNDEMSLKDIIITGPYGLKLIPGGTGFSDLSHMTAGQKMHLLNEFEELGEEFDYLLIDTAPGLDSNVAFFNTAASEIVVVANAEPTSITDAYALIKVLHKEHKVKKFSLLVNSVATKREAKQVYTKLSNVSDRFLNISLSYLGYLPFDNMISVSIKEQNPLLNRSRVTPYSAKLENIKDIITTNAPENPLNGNIQFFFKRMVEMAG